jgi:hypothetical protein
MCSRSHPQQRLRVWLIHGSRGFIRRFLSQGMWENLVWAGARVFATNSESGDKNRRYCCVLYCAEPMSRICSRAERSYIVEGCNVGIRCDGRGNVRAILANCTEHTHIFLHPIKVLTHSEQLR